MPCSPAIDAGTFNGAPLVDFDGEPRPQGLAPDMGMDKLGTTCLLRSAKTVSASRARYGDVLTYTLQITNVTPITTMNVVLTDVLPAAVNYLPPTLSASRGAPEYHAGTVTWTGALVPSDTVTISLICHPQKINLQAPVFLYKIERICRLYLSLRHQSPAPHKDPGQY